MAAKRKAFDIETKYTALSDIQNGDKSRQEIASKYGVSVYTLNGRNRYKLYMYFTQSLDPIDFNYTSNIS